MNSRVRDCTLSTLSINDLEYRLPRVLSTLSTHDLEYLPQASWVNLISTCTRRHLIVKKTQFLARKPHLRLILLEISCRLFLLNVGHQRRRHHAGTHCRDASFYLKASLKKNGFWDISDPKLPYHVPKSTCIGVNYKWNTKRKIGITVNRKLWQLPNKLRVLRTYANCEVASIDRGSTQGS